MLISQENLREQYRTHRTIQQSRAELNLDRFRFDNRALPPAGMSTSETVLLHNRDRLEQHKTVIDSFAHGAGVVSSVRGDAPARDGGVPNTRMTSRAQQRRDERFKSRSAFTRAVAHYRGQN
jgi:hypothetical protein